MDIAYIVFGVLICPYMVYLFFEMSSRVLPGKGKYLVTPAWMFRADLFTPDGQAYRRKLLVSMSIFALVSALFFWG
jgi:hypothetical protein